MLHLFAKPATSTYDFLAVYKFAVAVFIPEKWPTIPVNIDKSNIIIKNGFIT